MQNDHVNIVITQDSVGVVGPGQDIPMILSYGATFTERIRFYTSLAGVAEDLATTSSPEYIAAQRMFQQNPKPPRIAIGRGANAPTQRYLIEVATVRTNHTYTLTVAGEGVTTTDVEVPTYTNPTFTPDHNTESLLINGHGFTTGDGPFRLTTTNTLPTGLSLNTNYWVIVLDANTIQLAASYADAIAETEVTFTSDGTGGHTLNTATNDVIAAGIVDRLNSVVGNNYLAATTGSNGSLDVHVTGDAAGDWFSIEILDVTDLEVSQNHADPGVEADLNAIALIDNSWYGLVTLYNSNAYVLAAAGWTESNEKLYFADLPESDVATVALASANDTGEDLYDLGYERTAPCYHLSPIDMMGAALAARFLAKAPGSITAKFRSLRGVNAMALTETHKTNLKAKRVNHYYAQSGVSFTAEGVCSATGVFVDVTRNDDWVKGDMAARIFSTLAGNDIVPFTDAGIQVIANDVRGTLTEAVRRGIYASFDIEVPKAADVSELDKANRILPDLRWSAIRAGAIHNVDPVNGVVSL
jgi:hypothetical protein